MAKYYCYCSLLLVATATIAQAMPDPTAPTTRDDLVTLESVNINGLALNAIIVRPEHTVVIINGQVLQAGQYINGYCLQKIATNQVLLRAKDGKTIQLHLPLSIRKEGNLA